MSEFDEIRPYNDDEVAMVLQRLVHDSEFLNSIIRFNVPFGSRILAPVLRPLLRSRLLKQVKNILTVADFQAKIEAYLLEALKKTVTNLSVSGLEHLDPDSSYLFISNHRDIAMDPALVNWVLYHANFSTLRIAIGDNLLTKPFASDLMRLNKSFIVNRSAKAPREKLKAAKLLSKYIHHSVMVDGENVWIAQREGRAKDGIDKTNSAVIGMICLNRDKQQSLSSYVSEARIVPVSISYEYDPCDADKARELFIKARDGSYKKGEHEDVKSIAKGITGFKGNVHLHFGDVLSGEYADSEVVATVLSKQILDNYRLHPSNCIAYEKIEKRSPNVRVGEANVLFLNVDFQSEREQFEKRLASIPSDHRDLFLQSYANPVRAKLAVS